jgi:hypothetical protein
VPIVLYLLIPNPYICYDIYMKPRNPLKKRAQKLRDGGYSYKMINTKLKIAKSTLSNWFKDRPFTPNKKVLQRIQYGPIKSAEQKHNKKVQEINRLREIGAKEIGALAKRDLWLLGLGLYIGEGTKSHETIRIINSDPSVIRLAIKWFKEICDLKDENITIAVHLYPDNNIKKSLKFWSGVTGLPLNNFRKTQIDMRVKKSILKRSKLPHGTAHLTIISKGDPNKGVWLYRKINGWIDGVLKQI